MPNLGFAVRARKKILAKIYRSKLWKENSAAFKINHPFCEWHLEVGIESPTYVAHHPDRGIYSQINTPGGPERYCDLEGVNGGQRCTPMCKACHGAVDQSLVLCKCGRHYHHYTDIKCSTCKDEENPQRIVDRERAKALKKITDANKRKIARARQKEKNAPYVAAQKEKDKKYRKKVNDSLKARKRTVSKPKQKV